MVEDTVHIASCSFGKDSIATILLALEHNEPLDRAVFCEVMFDRENNISGERPEHIRWIKDTAIPRLSAMGVRVDVVSHLERDYKFYFSKRIEKGRHSGLMCGFPLGGMCFINRDLKVRPIQRYLKQFKDRKIVQYIGIAIDEERRLKKLSADRISLLEKYRYTEKDAYELCKRYDLLSPIYKTGTRGGCWFCPNCSIDEYIYIRKHHPGLWNELRELSHTPDLCSYGFRYGKTLQEIERLMDDQEFYNSHQLKLSL